MSALTGLVDRGLMAPDWAEALTPVDDRVGALMAFLDEEVAAGRPWLPERDLVFRAFRTPLADVRVLVVGQDPYPTPGHPIGLAFAVERHVRPLPPSLRNIYAELQADLGVTPPEHGDLTTWAEQGVMLLNRLLTVQAGSSDSHRDKGWEEVTGCAIGALADRARSGAPFVAVLWGKPARSLRPLLGDVACVESVHPSPLSAWRGFPGSKPFSQVNARLDEMGLRPVHWGAIAEGPE